MDKCFDCGAEVTRSRAEVRCGWCRFKFDIDTVWTDIESGLHRAIPAVSIAALGALLVMAVILVANAIGQTPK